MSYRSNVAIVFDRNVLTGDQRAKAEEILDSLCEGNYNLVKKNQDYLQFYNATHKWTNLYENVQDLYDFLEEIPEEAYSLLRTGEECGDLEMLGEGDFGLSYLFEVDPASLPLEAD
jgi:hypothetical protein